MITGQQVREVFRTPSFVIGSAIALFWIACAVAPGLFTDRTELEAVRNSEGVVVPRMGPHGDAWFGTDSIGRDIFARVVYGAEHTVITASLAALLAVLAGTVTGLLMGTSRRRRIDEVLSRLSEAVVSLPVVFLALMAFVVYGSSRLVLVLTIAGLSAPLVANAVRSAVLTETQRADASSAREQGAPGAPNILREIFPNVSKILVVEFTVRLRHAIFTVATLSFLGFSLSDARDADWGRDFGQTWTLIQAGQWWSAFFPALAITSLALATNLIGDSLDKL